MEKCAICETNDVFIKKRHLCKKCYIKYRKYEEPYLCAICGKNPIKIAKSRLCNGCYKLTRNQKKAKFDPEPREYDFINNYFKNNSFLYAPATFRLSNGERYTPDFYDKERKVFIEVVGTRQAYSQNKDKYAVFVEDFPEIKFEIRTFDGKLFKDSDGETGRSMQKCLRNGKLMSQA